MTNYTKTTDFAAKDSLPSGDSGKIIRGSEFETEFDNIATAVNSKSDANNPTFTGTVTIDGLTVNGNTILGNAATDTVTVTADIASNLIPSADDTYNLGAVGAEWNDLFIDGTANIDSLVADTADINGGTVDGVTIGGSSAGAITGTTITGTSFVTSGDMTFGDNDKAVFGTGSDLQIYHDGSNSYIRDAGGTGNLILRGQGQIILQSDVNQESYVVANNNGSVDLYYDNAQKLATTSTGIDVTGTVVADNVDLAATGALESVGTLFIDIDKDNSSTTAALKITADGKTKNVAWFVENGDINFYESTGTTPKFFWDASAESLGIGTTSPASTLHLFEANPTITFQEGAGSTTISGDAANLEYTVPSGKYHVFSGGNVGIGTNSPEKRLHIFDSTQTNQTIRFGNPSATPLADINYDASGFEHLYISVKGTTTGYGNIVFSTGPTPSEAMRISSGGHLLVGKTSQDVTNDVGFEAKNDGLAVATTDGSQSLILNRKTSDGTIAEFRKDNTAVGSIGIQSSGFVIDGEASHSGLRFTSAGVTPRLNGAESNGTQDLGEAGVKWKDLYLSGGAYLGGTAAANKLDDYEEGTWTPTPTSGTLNAGATGSYIKIGNLVHVQGQLSFSANGTTNRINGLPFRPRIESTLSAIRQRFLIYSNSTTAIYGYCQDVNEALFLQNENRSNHNFDTADATYSFAFTYET